MGAGTAVQLHRIRITTAAIAEMVGTVALVSVPRHEVRKLRIERGIVAERPWVLALFGLCGTAIGVLALLYLLRTLSPSYRGEVLPAKMSWGLLTLLAIGPGAIYFALRRGMVMFVDTTRSTRKLGFGATVTRDQLIGFVDQARTLGLEVEVGVELAHARIVSRAPS